MKIRLFSILTLFLLTSTLYAQSHEKLTFSHYKAHNGVEFDYTVLTPAAFNPSDTYPTLLAFPPGDMDRAAVEWAARNLWASSKEENWLIVIPTIPEGSWHTHPSHHALEAFLNQIKKDYNVSGDIFHLSGFGTGARAAITYASMSNSFFETLTVAGPKPWNRWRDRDLKRWVERNSHIDISILVGERDTEGKNAVKRVEKFFREGSFSLNVRVIEGVGEDLTTLHNGPMLDAIIENANL